MNLSHVTQAKYACYDRLHPRVDVDSSRGARRLYDAVCELWVHAVQREHEGRLFDACNLLDERDAMGGLVDLRAASGRVLEVPRG